MKEIKCSNCTAACCGPNIEVQLTDKEAEFLGEGGTQISQVLPPFSIEVDYFPKPANYDAHQLSTAPTRQLKSNHGLYVLNSKCGYVKEENGWQQCRAFHNPKRPRICGEFPEAGNTCRLIRISRLVD